MYKILLCDDDHDVVQLVKTYCELDGYEVYEAESGLEAIEKAKEIKLDLIIMDVMMPNVDGFTAVQKIRETSNVPIIMLTAKSEEYDKLHGFNIGVDDFILKPFSPREVMARVKAVLKRTSDNVSADSDEITAGSIKINELSRNVKVSNVEVSLTPKEFDLLVYLVKNKKQVMTREQLLSKVWGFDYYGDVRTVDTHIKSLRERLNESRKCIKTVWGIGYKFEDDI